MVHGSIPALITPFRNGIVDERAFQAFVERQISEGSHALVPCGTTGESVTLSLNEHVRVVEMCVEAAGGKVPVIAGAGSNNTAHAIELAEPDSPWWQDLRVLLKYKDFVDTKLFDAWAQKLAQSTQNGHRVPASAIRSWMQHWRHDLTVEQILAQPRNEFDGAAPDGLSNHGCI